MGKKYLTKKRKKKLTKYGKKAVKVIQGLNRGVEQTFAVGKGYKQW